MSKSGKLGQEKGCTAMTMEEKKMNVGDWGQQIKGNLRAFSSFNGLGLKCVWITI